MGVPSFQCTAAAYVFPMDRGDAARCTSRNCGCVSSRLMKRCPTVPVAPKRPTGINSSICACATLHNKMIYRFAD